MRNFVGQWSHRVKQWQNFSTETLKNVFSNAKNGFKNDILRHFFRANFFTFVLLISNYTVFLGQFEINLHLWIRFSTSRNCTCTRWSGSCNFSFLKNPLVQINFKLNSKLYDYLYQLSAQRVQVVDWFLSALSVNMIINSSSTDRLNLSEC